MSASNALEQIELHKALAPRYAYRYSFEFSRLFQEDWHAEMLRLLPERSERVLDLGCGTGFFLAELEALRPGAVGLDISHAMLRVSEQYVPGARLVTADAERLPFIDRSFDAIFCKGSLHHTRDHVRFLSNCARALRPEGVLIMSEPCNDNFLIRWARAAMYRISPHFHPDDRGFTKDELVGLMERSGFELVYAGRYGFLGYVFAGFPDHIGILRWVPGNAWIVRKMLAIDRWICSTRFLRILSFQVVVSGKPRAR
ncbi:MAG: class I SAM-dependent methyltransferase [Planctomycetaceae bacterium]|nr:class I SAM-dependent methyltransferase [Planctomycetaceae bacterium]